MKKTKLDIISDVLVLGGAVNTGLIGFFGTNVISSIVGVIPFGETIAYVTIGFAGVYKIVNLFMD